MHGPIDSRRWSQVVAGFHKQLQVVASRSSCSHVVIDSRRQWHVIVGHCRSSKVSGDPKLFYAVIYGPKFS